MSLMKPKYFSLKKIEGDSSKLFAKLGNCQCAIGVQRNDGLWWSVVLALLYPVKKKEKFIYRFTKLVEISGRKKNAIPNVEQRDMEQLFDLLKQYNPFLDRQSCFDNSTLKTLVIILKERVETQLRNNPCKDRHSLLQTACQLLECNIAICEAYKDHPSIKDFQISGDKKLPGKFLFLYLEWESTDSPSVSFHFGIEGNYGKVLQKRALSTILRVANFSEKWITKVTIALASGNNIPKHLVENELQDAIVLLYKQPYTLSKLEEAGYVVDPFIFSDNQENAFSLCTGKENSRLMVHIFYNYLSSPERNPDNYLEQKLKNAENVLETNRNIFIETNQERNVLVIEQLVKFNNFRASVAEQFHEINMEIPFTSASCDDLKEVSRRKEKIVAILSTYSKYFSFKNYGIVPHFSTTSNMLVQFIMEVINFEKHALYSEMLDINVALQLFDNLVFLKHKLKHNLADLDAYEKIESKFLLFLFTCEIYGFSQILYPSSFEAESEGSNRQMNSIRNRSFLHNVLFERRELYHSLGEFRDHIASTTVCLETKTQFFSTLTSVPIIHDVAALRTILRYLDNAFNTTHVKTMGNITHMEEENYLVVERLLQVIGENLKECPIDDVTLGKSLLMSSFPPQVRNDICTIRDTLVHVIERTNAKNRLLLEKDTKIFKDVVRELKHFHSQCAEFIAIMELLMQEDILLRDHSFRQQTLQVCNLVVEKGHSIRKYVAESINSGDILETSETIRYQMKTQVHTEEIEKPQAVEDIRRQLQEKKFFRDRCKQYLEVHFDCIRHYMEKVQDEPSRKEKYCNSVLFYVHCIEVLFRNCIEILTEKRSDIALFYTVEVKSVLNQIEVVFSDYVKKCDRNKQNKVVVPNKRNKVVPNKWNKVVPNKWNKVVPNEWNKVVVPELRREKEHLMTVYDNICNKTSSGSSLKQEFRSIAEFSKSLRIYCPLSENEKAEIIKNVPKIFIDHSRAKSSPMSTVERISNGQEIPAEPVSLDHFCNKKRDLKKLCISKDIKDLFGKLKNSLDKNERIGKRDYQKYCSNFGWSEKENARSSLNKIVCGDPFHTQNDVLKLQKAVHIRFLSNRVESLERFLITSNPKISEIWMRAKDPKEKQHVCFLIVQRFLNDKRFQAIVEMLLFDCMCIQKNNAELRNLWIKTSHLFSGINLRNLLAHKDPLIEELGRILGPDDLATEIVLKCLDIVEKKHYVEMPVRQQFSHESCNSNFQSRKWNFLSFPASAFLNSSLSFTFFIFVLFSQPLSTN